MIFQTQNAFTSIIFATLVSTSTCVMASKRSNDESFRVDPSSSSSASSSSAAPSSMVLPPVPIADMNETERYSAAFIEASTLIANELKRNGMNTHFMIGKDEPSLEIVNANLPLGSDIKTAKTKNLSMLAYKLWKFKELNTCCLELLEKSNIIELPRRCFDCSSDDLNHYFPKTTQRYVMARGNVDPEMISAYLFFIKDHASKSIEKMLALSGPINMKDGDLHLYSSGVTSIFQETSLEALGMAPTTTIFSFDRTTKLPSELLTERQSFEEALYSISYNLSVSKSTHSNGLLTSDFEVNNAFLSTLFAACSTVKADRLEGFNPKIIYSKPIKTPSQSIRINPTDQERISYLTYEVEFLKERIPQITDTNAKSSLICAQTLKEAEVYARQKYTTKDKIEPVQTSANGQVFFHNSQELQNIRTLLHSLKELFSKAVEEKIKANTVKFYNTYAQFLEGRSS